MSALLYLFLHGNPKHQILNIILNRLLKEPKILNVISLTFPVVVAFSWRPGRNIDQCWVFLNVEKTFFFEIVYSRRFLCFSKALLNTYIRI